MGYKMPRVSTKGPQGIAALTEGKKGNKTFVRVAFEESGDKYFIAKTKDNCPDYVQNGTFYVNLSPDKKSINSMRAVSGQFRGKCTEFVSRKDEPPVPNTKTIQSSRGTFEVVQFGVIITITKGKYKGMDYFLSLNYDFVPAMVEYPSGSGTMREVAGLRKSKSRYVEMLDNFIMATKAVVKSPIPWSDNILPTMQKRVLQADAEFDFIVKDGWISTIIPPDLNEDVEAEDWGDEAETVPQEEDVSVPQDDWGDPDEEDFDDGDTETSGDDSDAPWDEVED